jgi:flavin reductase (DIM6/NTAB) family NADH-FMN oxidoreductase RutF
VVNLPPASLWPKVLACGQCSGRTVDKFATVGLTPLPAAHVMPPLIAECVVNIECRVTRIESFGDHDLFAGEVQAVHLAPEFADARGELDPTKLTTVVMTSAGFYDLGAPLEA